MKKTLTTIVLTVLVCIGIYFAWQNRNRIIESSDPNAQKIVDSILTPGATDAPYEQPVDKLRKLAPATGDFQSFIRRANVIEGKNVLLLHSGTNLYGADSFRDTQSVNVPQPGFVTFLFGDHKVTLTDETFTATVATNIDEAVYLPAILSGAVVSADPAEPVHKVVVKDAQGQDEVVEMQSGMVTLPVVNTCWTGFGIKPWEFRQEPGQVTRFEKVTDAAYWLIKAGIVNDTYSDWALPRFRWAVIRASYNSIMPLENGQRSWRVLDGIHSESLGDLKPSTGGTPNAYDLLLGYFNLHAQEYGFAKITKINIVVVNRGTVYCGSDAPLMNAELQNTLNGPVPSGLLLQPSDLRPAIKP